MKLKAEHVAALNSPPMREILAEKLPGTGQQAIYKHLFNNHDNNRLTKMDALQAISELLAVPVAELLTDGEQQRAPAVGRGGNQPASKPKGTKQSIEQQLAQTIGMRLKSFGPLPLEHLLNLLAKSLKREALLEDCLRELVELKNLEEEQGDWGEYHSRQEAAYIRARQLLKNPERTNIA